jgi:glycine cleavage system H lipoate-binding protein
MGSIRLKRDISGTSDPCIWMQAQVVRRKFCNLDYECNACGYDRALQRVSDANRRHIEQGKPLRGKRGKIVYWKDKMKERSPGKRPCIHHMKKRIDFRNCTYEYRCGSCEFDQYFSDQLTVHAVVQPVDFLNIEGFRIPHGFYLHRGHAWVKLEEGAEVRVGLDDFALRLLGPLDRIESPLIGKQVKQDQADILLNRDNHAARMLTPISGVITALNPKLREKGGLANQDPYAEGWIARIHADNLRQEMKQLMIADETKGFLGKEVDRLYEVIEETAGPLAADGGGLANDIFGNLPQIGWERLTRTFLRT